MSAGLSVNRGVDLLDVAQVHVLGVLAASGDLGALAGSFRYASEVSSNCR